MKTSRVSVSEFFRLLDKYEGQTSETVIQFPLEYYQGENYFILYKTIMSKTYSTGIAISERNTILLNGEQQTVESFISDLLTNHNAIQILKELDKDLIVKLNTE